ncbi:MAG: hypothetical protein AAF763_10235 [Pseudomonadota bacterium]
MDGGAVNDLLADGERRNGPPPVLSKSAFADELGLTKARVSQLIDKGLPVRADGRLDRAAAFAWYRENVSPSRRKALMEPGHVDPRHELVRIRAEAAQLELDRAKGALIDRAAAEKAIFERARIERDAHLAFFSRAAPQIAAESGADPARLFAAFDRLMREHLAHLAATPMEGLRDEDG